MKKTKLLVMIFLLFLTIFIIVNKDISQKYIHDLICQKLNENNSYRINYHSLTFKLPFTFKIKTVDIADEQGKWLAARDIQITLIPSLAMLKKQININEVKIKNIEFIRQPILAPTKTQKDSEYNVLIHKLLLEQIMIHHDNKIYELSLNSQLSWEGPNQNLNFSGIINSNLGKCDLQGIYKLKQNLLRLEKIDIMSNILKFHGVMDLNFKNYQLTGNLNISTNNDIKTNVDAKITSSYSDDIINFHIDAISDLDYKDTKLLNQDSTNLNVTYDTKINEVDFSLKIIDKINTSFLIKKSDHLLQFSKLRIKNNYKDMLTGDLKLDLETKLLSGNLKLAANNLAHLHPSLSGTYNALLKIKVNNGKQLFDFNVKAQKLPYTQFTSITLQTIGSLSYQAGDHLMMNLEKFFIATANNNIKNKGAVIITYNKGNFKLDTTRLSLGNGYFTLGGFIEENNIEIDFTLNSTLENFISLILPPIHQIKGEINSKLKISGILREPKINGKININNGNYKHLKLGLEIKNISSGLEIRDHQLFTNQCNFTDIKGAKAKCIIKGDFQSPNKNFEGKMNAKNFYLLLPQIGTQGNIDIDLTCQGSNKSVNLFGDIIIQSAEIKISEHFGPNIAKLNIIEKNNDHVSAKNSYPYFLDINIIGKNQIFIRGWGLDIELKGNLKLTNIVNDLLVKGVLSTIRGRYQAFGKYFNIARGDLVFEGEVPPSPYLNVIGTTTAKDVQINLALTGPLLRPSLSIYSNPPLAQEEALSMILFGKKSDNISAFQAISLANSIKQFSGHGDNKMEIIGNLRKILHVDEINISSSDDTGDTTIGIGKYLSDRLYLKIEQDVEAGISKSKVEYELRPNISIEGEINQEGNNTIGVNWKRDY